MTLGLLGPLIMVILGLTIILGPPPGYSNNMPLEFSWVLVIFGGIVGVIVAALAACNFVVGYSLGQRKNYVFCFVIACLICINVPLGTILGVFTLLVLSRPSVKESFATGRGETP